MNASKRKKRSLALDDIGCWQSTHCASSWTHGKSLPAYANSVENSRAAWNRAFHVGSPVPGSNSSPARRACAAPTSATMAASVSASIADNFCIASSFTQAAAASILIWRVLTRAAESLRAVAFALGSFSLSVFPSDDKFICSSTLISAKPSTAEMSVFSLNDAIKAPTLVGPKRCLNESATVDVAASSVLSFSVSFGKTT